MGMLLIGAVMGSICGAIGYKFNAAAGVVTGVVGGIIGAIGYDNIPTLVDRTWGAGSCPFAGIDPAGHAECVVEVWERFVAAFWFLVGGWFAGWATYEFLEHQYGEPPL